MPLWMKRRPPRGFIPPEAVPDCWFWEVMRRDALVCCMQIRRVVALTA